MNKIDIEDYKTLINLLKDFAGNPETAYSDESVLRSIFVTNFIEVFNIVDINNEKVYNSLNKFIQDIITLKIPIIDMYKYFGINKISLEQLDYFFSNYFIFLDKSDLQVHKIYLLTINDNTSFADLLNDSHYIPTIQEKNYIKPKIQYSYKESNKYFISQLTALREFYKIQWYPEISNIDYLNEINNNITNIEFKQFISSLINSYNANIFYLLAIDQSRPFSNLLNLLNTFNLENIEYKNNKYINSIDDIKQIFINNISSIDIPNYIQNLSQRLYTSYLSDLNVYAKRNQQFLLESHLKKIIPSLSQLNILNIWNYIFDVYVYCTINKEINNEYVDKLNNWINDLVLMKNKIYGPDGLIIKILSQDHRFERSF